MKIHMQRPAGGCENCGGEVRTWKADGWVCWTCIERISHVQA